MSDDLSKREVWIDTARGIAILLVVLGHIFPVEHKVNQIIYSFHVPIFFNGYVCHLKILLLKNLKSICILI